MSNILHRAEITDVKSSNNQLHLRHTVSSSAKKKSKHSDLLNVLVIFLQTESPKHSHILKLLTRAMTETSSWKPTSTIGLQCSLNKEQTNNRGVSRLLWGPSHAAEWWRAQWCIQALTELELATGMYSHWMQRDCSLLLPKDNQFPFKKHINTKSGNKQKQNRSLLSNLPSNYELKAYKLLSRWQHSTVKWRKITMIFLFCC